MPPDDDADDARHRPPGRLRRRAGARARARSSRRCATRVDAAFLPRRIVHVDALPREPTGKLTRGAPRRARGARTCARRAAMSERRRAVAHGVDDRASTIRRSTATSPASRCCPASRCSPRCSRRRRASRRSRRASAARRAWRRQVPRAGRPGRVARRSTSRLGARTLDWQRRRRRARRRQRPVRARRPRRRARAPMKVDGGTAPPDRLDRASASAATCWQLRADALDRDRRRPARRAPAAAPDRCSTSSSTGATRAPLGALPRRARSAGRPTWRDVYRHLHTFAATVLDRVYLLQERFDAVRASRRAASRRSSSRSRAARACSPSAPTSAASRRCA